MSKLKEYSKFDHLKEDDSDDDESHEAENAHSAQKEAKAAAPAVPPTKGGLIKRDESSGRYRFEYNGNPVYEFEQSLDEMILYILPPPYIKKGNQIMCVIAANHFKLGLVGHGSGPTQQWFLNEGTYGTVDVDESTWTLEDYDGNNATPGQKIIVVTLTKANRGTLWEAALKGNFGSTTKTEATKMDAFAQEQVKKDLMLQRFNEENPGFDFSGADFNGSVPDPRQFMGGVKYQ